MNRIDLLQFQKTLTWFQKTLAAVLRQTSICINIEFIDHRLWNSSCFILAHFDTELVYFKTEAYAIHKGHGNYCSMAKGCRSIHSDSQSRRVKMVLTKSMLDVGFLGQSTGCVASFGL